jgi:hypothetical protein
MMNSVSSVSRQLCSQRPSCRNQIRDISTRPQPHIPRRIRHTSRRLQKTIPSQRSHNIRQIRTIRHRNALLRITSRLQLIIPLRTLPHAVLEAVDGELADVGEGFSFRGGVGGGVPDGSAVDVVAVAFFRKSRVGGGVFGVCDGGVAGEGRYAGCAARDCGGRGGRVYCYCGGSLSFG